MAQMNNIVKSPIQGKLGTLNRSSGYQYRDFWYTSASGHHICKKKITSNLLYYLY